MYILINGIYTDNSPATTTASSTIGGVLIAVILCVAGFEFVNQMQRIKLLKNRKLKLEAF